VVGTGVDPVTSRFSVTTCTFGLECLIVLSQVRVGVSHGYVWSHWGLRGWCCEVSLTLR
jgi:hypothetical protein